MGNVITNKRGTKFADLITRHDGKDALCVDMASDIQIGSVELKDGDSNERANLVLRNDGKWALACDIASDIQIGAIELKDAISDNRATVIQQGSTGALVTADLTEYQKSTVNIYGEGNVPFDTILTLTSYIVPVGKTFKFTGAIVGGNADGEFYLEVSGTRIALIRNSASSRTLIVELWNPVRVNSGGIISIKAKNVSYRQQTRQFESTINGFTVPN